MVRGVASLLALVLLATGCSAGRSAEGDQRDAELGRPLVVFAASSLTDALEAVAAELEASTGIPVLLNLAGSQTLAAQLVEGAPADVFISADTVQMDVVAAAGLLAAEPVTLATNTLAIAVEPGNPAGVRGLADLARPDLVVVLPAPQVPAGRYARELLERAGVEVTPSSLERSVRAALAKVTLGEADAAIVYASDVVAAGDAVEGVGIPDAESVAVTYPMAVLRGATAPDPAAAFLDLAGSSRGQRILAEHGFGAP